MERCRLTILVESRIRWKVYVRFGGEYWETYHRNMTRRRVLSLHYRIKQEAAQIVEDELRRVAADEKLKHLFKGNEPVAN